MLSTPFSMPFIFAMGSEESFWPGVIIVFVIILIINFFVVGFAFLALFIKDKNIFRFKKFLFCLLMTTIINTIATYIGLEAGLLVDPGIDALSVVLTILFLSFFHNVAFYRAYLKISFTQSLCLGLWIAIFAGPLIDCFIRGFQIYAR